MGPRAADRLCKSLRFNGGERVSDASVKLSFCGSALLERSRPFASGSDLVTGE
jgi:hypothetical protein